MSKWLDSAPAPATASVLRRLLILDPERCKFNSEAWHFLKRKSRECGRGCIEVVDTASTKRITICEDLCAVCLASAKHCPGGAVKIVNLPTNLDADAAHRFGPNGFKLCRLPTPRPGQVMGLVGTNGIGKTTALRILAGKLKPNLGLVMGGDASAAAPDWPQIFSQFQGSELRGYFDRLLAERAPLRTVLKIQVLDEVAHALAGHTVHAVLAAKCARPTLETLMATLELHAVADRHVDRLSGGELQRFALALCCSQAADVFVVDEPSSYLDVKQRLTAAKVIRALLSDADDGNASDAAAAPPPPRYVLAVEHDLALLDYLSDAVCVLYGAPACYGVATVPFAVREGINVFLAGHIPTENVRFRESALSFRPGGTGVERSDATETFRYPAMTRTLARGGGGGGDASFVLRVEAGAFTDSELIVLLGENGTGKTTFIRMLAGLLCSDEQEAAAARGAGAADVAALGAPRLSISHKPQVLAPPRAERGALTVQQLLRRRVGCAAAHDEFVDEVLLPLRIEPLLARDVADLSGGERQRVALALALGAPADVYLIDEPSAYLDAEQRVACARVIKRFVLRTRRAAFVVEHDFVMATYLADRVVVYAGTPAVEATASAPQPLLAGMNRFLRQLEVTFRRDPTNHRPRINKPGSSKDREQKASGDYFFLDDD